jgi:energy-coupling factor transporter ATP-binding protein EcfA2
MFSFEDLSLTYPHSRMPLFSRLSVVLQPGELLLLRGANGSGKTSLLNSLSGVIPHRVKAELSGRIRMDGTDLQQVPLNEKLRYLSYQMSDPDHQLFFPTLRKELAFSPENLGLPVDEIEKRISANMEIFGLDDLRKRDPANLSRGEKTMLVLAVCAAMQSTLILLDEPTAALGIKGKARVMDWLRQELLQGRMVICADHDNDLAVIASQVLEMKQ